MRINELHRFRVVRTVKLPATDTTGTAVRADVVDGSRHAIVPWDYALDAGDNHLAAAMACLGGVKPHSFWPADAGYYFTF